MNEFLISLPLAQRGINSTPRAENYSTLMNSLYVLYFLIPLSPLYCNNWAAKVAENDYLALDITSTSSYSELYSRAKRFAK
jgi:hypothetical protein